MISFYIRKCKCHSSDLERQRQTERLGADYGQPVDSTLPGRPLDLSPPSVRAASPPLGNFGKPYPKIQTCFCF